MKLIALIVAILAVSTSFAADSLPRSTPELQGIASQAIVDYIGALDKIDTPHSFMIIRHGHVVAEGWWKPEGPEKPHVLWSLTKSFTSTAVGLAIEEGKLSLDDPIIKFFPNDLPENPSENLKAIKVRDLLSMSCGHDGEPKAESPEKQTVKQFLAVPVVHTPGTHFQYNSMGSYVLSAIVTKVTGKTLSEYLKPRLFEPLGIENYQWNTTGESYCVGGSGLFIRTEDIAKFGQLYLQKGKWNGKQLIPEKWVETATSKKIDNDKESHAKIGIDWQQGYCYQFWRCTHNAFRGDGRACQFCVVIPEFDTVVAVTGESTSFQDFMDAIWNHLYPALKKDALPADPAGVEKIKAAVSKLEAHPAAKK